MLEKLREEKCNKFLYLSENDQHIALNYVGKKINFKKPSLYPFLWRLGMIGFCLLFIFLIFFFKNNDKANPLTFSWLTSAGISTYTGVVLSKHISSNSLKEPTIETGDDKVVVCYYNLPNQSKGSQLMPQDIHSNLCTHINVAFARIVNKEIALNDYQYDNLKNVVNLKNNNRDLKILLSVGGSGNDRGFSDMVIDHASRKTFIRSIKSILRNYTLDGIDLDWEFPALQKQYAGSRERQHFSQLLREIRMEFIREKRNYLLTLATAAPETIVDVSYDIDQVNQYVDFVNIMTYDYHFYSKYTPFTGLNSPLYSRSTEQLYMATLNINYTVHKYMDKGLDRSKIVVGIPTYGHTFTLVNAHNTRVGSPASGFGSIGGSGFIDYPDVCRYLAKFNDVKLELDLDAKVPYLHRNNEWVSYDTPQSVTEKAQYIKDLGLKGAMIYSLNADDYAGVCTTTNSENTNKFPLAVSIKNTLITYEFSND